MAKDLVSFLAETPISELEQTVTISGRLSAFTFKIKPMSSNQFYTYQQIATTMGKDKNIKFNTGRFNELIILNHVVDPNFRNASTLESAGVNTPQEFLNKFFLAGELVELADKITEISGFNQTEQELEDEVKNS